MQAIQLSSTHTKEEATLYIKQNMPRLVFEEDYRTFNRTYNELRKYRHDDETTCPILIEKMKIARLNSDAADTVYNNIVASFELNFKITKKILNLYYEYAIAVENCSKQCLALDILTEEISKKYKK
jgi:hypothetical protein